MSGLGWVTQDSYGGLVVTGYPPGPEAMSTWRAGATVRARQGVVGGLDTVGGPETVGVQGQWTGR